MKINWPFRSTAFNPQSLEDVASTLKAMIKELDYSFGKIRPDDQISIGGGAFIRKHLSVTTTLNFAAPGAVPGDVSLTQAVPGAALGDVVCVSSSITWPAGFTLHGFVSAADTVTVRWVQHSGAAANPDGSGATYRIDVWQH